MLKVKVKEMHFGDIGDLTLHTNGAPGIDMKPQLEPILTQFVSFQ